MSRASNNQSQIMRYIGMAIILLAALCIGSKENKAESQTNEPWITYAQFSELIKPLPDSFELAIKNFVKEHIGPISAKHIPADLIWPFSGAINSYMSPDHPIGIDIDALDRLGENVVAVADGIVTFGGGDICCHYGLYVVVDHGFFLETLYAHLSSIAVVVGQRISQGDIVGQVGCTGYCTGDHLHFELHAAGSYLNPLDYLP